MMKRTRVIDTQRAVSELQDLATFDALDHRQTISVSPVSSPRAAVNKQQLQQQPPPPPPQQANNAKSNNNNNYSKATTPSKESGSVIGASAVSASVGHRKMKYSSSSPPSSRRASSSSSSSPSPCLLLSKKQQRHHKRPPRSKHNRPKSVVSDATNSTYLSSDSEEDTIRSGGDGSSAFSGASSSNQSGASQGSSGGGAGIATRKSQQLRHPHIHPPTRSYSSETSPRSLYCHPPHPASGSSASSSSPSSFLPRRGSPETNHNHNKSSTSSSSRFHLQQTRNTSNTAAAAAGEMSPPDSPIGIGDDVADFLLQYSDNEDDPQQMLYLTAPSSVPMPLLADQAFEATMTGTTSAILPLETSSSSSSDEDDAFLQLIQESSTRWRQTVEQTINKTAHTSLMVGYNNNNNMIIDTSSSPIHNTTTAIATFDHQHHLAHPPVLLAPPSASAALINKKAVIEEQQAEIEALRAQLEQQRIDTAPVTQIEVVVANHNNTNCYGPTTMVVDMVTDDLTMVSSDFAPITVPPKTLKRPDAASVVSKPPAPKSTTRAFTMLMGGQPVKAVFTGNLTHDIDGDYGGVGMIRFSNGNVYRGELRHSQLHGKGSLHCPLTNETFTGRFEDGQYAGP